MNIPSNVEFSSVLGLGQDAGALEATRSANAKQAHAISTSSALPLVVHACSCTLTATLLHTDMIPAHLTVLDKGGDANLSEAPAA